MIIINRRLSPKERAELDNAQAQAANNAANIDYLAMMSGIDLDDDTEVDDGAL
jgi:hypothetical protein